MSLFCADDTNLFMNGSNINELESIINSEWTEIAKLLKVNRLSIDINKTHYMIYMPLSLGELKRPGRFKGQWNVNVRWSHYGSTYPSSNLT